MAASRASTAVAPASRSAVVADYVALTKPKVQSLLLLTTVAAMEIAGDPSLALIFATCLGGYLSAGGAGAVNHWFDRDLDARMARTASRPVPSGRVSPRAALAFGCLLGALLVLWLAVAVNPLAAALSACGFLGYTLVYTMWLKRRTPQNIVIGGGRRGAAPPARRGGGPGGGGGTARYPVALAFFWAPPPLFGRSLLLKGREAKGGGPP